MPAGDWPHLLHVFSFEKHGTSQLCAELFSLIQGSLYLYTQLARTQSTES